MRMRPLREPIKLFIYTGGSRVIRTVIVDGQVLVADGAVVGADEVELWSKIQQVGDRMLANVPNRDWAQRTHLEMSPMSFPTVAPPAGSAGE